MSTPSRKRDRDDIRVEGAATPTKETSSPATPDFTSPSDAPEVLLTAARVPRSVGQRMRRAGAHVETFEGIMSMDCVFGDAAFDVWDGHLSTTEEEDPRLDVIFKPPAGARHPPAHAVPGILREAGGVLEVYAPLRRGDFISSTLPPLPIPLPRPALHGSRFASAAMSGTQVLSRIQAPASAACPSIMAQVPGTYLCTVRSAWVGTQCDTHLFRS